jgi:tripartite-type tricarboxylate transporter receptor subunit TctC
MKAPVWWVAGILPALATAAAWPTLAHDYPNQSIRVISDSAAGSAVDMAFRNVSSLARGWY